MRSLTGSGARYLVSAEGGREPAWGREAEELYQAATALRRDVVRWLRKHHRALCPKGLTA